jgi:hypothetical protein
MSLKQEILDKITKDDMMRIMTSLGADYKIINGQLIFQSICHHSASYKLYYYDNENEDEIDPSFHCYSSCGQMSIFDLIMKVEGYNFIQAINFYCDELNLMKNLNVKRRNGFNMDRFEVDDVEYLSQYKAEERINNQSVMAELPEYSENIFKIFPNVYPATWETEGISTETMKKYEIYMLTWQHKIVIPHRDINGRLIGIRTRVLLENEIAYGGKYKPLFFENVLYSHPIQSSLYGVHQNKQAIIRQKKIMIVEPEKGVMRGDTLYGDDNFVVALCGTSFSIAQRNLVVFELGVEEVFIALDKEHKDDMDEQETLKAKRHGDKIEKIISMLKPFCTVHVLYDEANILKYKECPLDVSQKKLELLMENKITIE